VTEASPIATWDLIAGNRTALPHGAKTLVHEVTLVLAPNHGLVNEYTRRAA
jgi:hypothetical protein